MGKVNTFRIVLNNGDSSVKAGDTLTGHVRLQLSGDLKANEVRISFTGLCSTQWAEAQKSSPMPEMNSALVDPVLAQELYFSHPLVLWNHSLGHLDAADTTTTDTTATTTSPSQSTSPSSSTSPSTSSSSPSSTQPEPETRSSTTDLNANNTTLTTSPTPTTTTTTTNTAILTRGTHKMDFQFVVPDSAPSTFSGKNGFVQYQLKAVIDLPVKRGVRDAVVTTKKVNVSTELDLNDVYDARESVQMSRDLKDSPMLLPSVDCQATLRLARKGFVQGDVIPVEFAVHNHSGRDIQNVSLLLKMIIVYKAGDRRCQSECVLGRSVLGRVSARKSLQGMDKKLRVPVTCQPSGLPGCSLIDIKYRLELKVKPTSLSFKRLRLHSDVIVGTTPLAPTSLHDSPPDYWSCCLPTYEEIMAYAPPPYSLHKTPSSSTSDPNSTSTPIPTLCPFTPPPPPSPTPSRRSSSSSSPLTPSLPLSLPPLSNHHNHRHHHHHSESRRPRAVSPRNGCPPFPRRAVSTDNLYRSPGGDALVSSARHSCYMIACGSGWNSPLEAISMLDFSWM